MLGRDDRHLAFSASSARQDAQHATEVIDVTVRENDG